MAYKIEFELEAYKQFNKFDNSVKKVYKNTLISLKNEKTREVWEKRYKAIFLVYGDTELEIFELLQRFKIKSK